MEREWSTPYGARVIYQPARTAHAVLAGVRARVSWLDTGHLHPLLEWLSECVLRVYTPMGECADLTTLEPAQRVALLDVALAEPVHLAKLAQHIVEEDALSESLEEGCADYIGLVVEGGCQCVTCTEARARDLLSPQAREEVEREEGPIWEDPDCDLRALDPAARQLVEAWWPGREGVDMGSPWWSYQLSRIHQRARGRAAAIRKKEKDIKTDVRRQLYGG